MGYTFTKAEDEDLIRRILRSPSAYREFISRHQRIVSIMTSRMIRNEEDRKDISQDVFMKAYHRLSSFRFQSKLSTWVGSIAYNTCISYLEKKKHIVYVDFSLPGGDGEDQKSEPRDNGIVSHDEWLSSKQVHQSLQIAIEQLPPIYKTMIALYHSEEISYEEISEITNLPMGTVKSYLFRARKKIKESLLQQYKTEEI
jgi:RNA polymerase sigma factor (sigma-70 family)